MAELLSNSLNSIHIESVQICVTLSFISRCLLTNKPITLCLTFFCRTVCKQTKFWGNDVVSQHFRPVTRMNPKPQKSSLFVKWLLWCKFLISEGCFLWFLGQYTATTNNKSWIVGFPADSALKCSTEFDVFLDYPKTESFKIFR